MPRLGVRLGAALAALACVLAGFGAVPASAAGTTCQGWTGALPPGTATTSTSATDVAVASACDVWMAQGDHFEHWTGGSSWTSVAVPGSNPVALTGISAISATDIWAIGRDIQSGAVVPLHWDGTTWSRRLGPTVAGASLESVRAVSSADIWAVGRAFSSSGHQQVTLIEHWNGSSWAQSPQPSVPFDSELHSVSAVSATSAWAVGAILESASDTTFGSALIERWDGQSWARVPNVPSPGDESRLFSVSAVSGSDVWAVGDTHDDSGITQTLIEHWDGHSWTRVYSPSPGTAQGVPGVSGDLLSVDAISPSNAWAVGYYRDAATETVHPLVLHWDGTVWSQRVAPQGLQSLRAVSGSDPGNLWLAGSHDGNILGAVPLAQAQIAVNANAALGESGWVTRSVAAANLAPGTNPGVAVQPDGSSLVAWQASSGLLWTLDSAGSQRNTQHMVAAGTSPVVATLSGGGFAVVFQSAGDDVLRMLGANGSANALGNGPAMAAGTSPAIAGDGNGGFEVAYHAAGTDHLVTVSQAGATRDTGAVMAAGASPAVAALAGGGYEVVYPSASGVLTAIGPDGTARPLGSGPGIAAGTSPAVAVDSRATVEAVYQAAGGELWTVNAGTARDTGVAAASGTSPALAALVAGGFEIAYQATAGRELFTLSGSGPARDAGFALGVHDSPVMAVLPPSIPSPTTVPGVIGEADAAARADIAGSGLTVGPITVDNTCRADAGVVTGQSPQAGASAKLGDPVSLAESSGKTPQGFPCHPVLPNLFGFDDKTAQNTITSLGLVVGQVTTGSNCAVSKDDVFSQNPGPGTVAPGTVVSLIEANGLDQHNKPCIIQ